MPKAERREVMLRRPGDDTWDYQEARELDLERGVRLAKRVLCAIAALLILILILGRLLV